MTPQELAAYWNAIETEPLPPPVREFTDQDYAAMQAMYNHDFELDGTPHLLDTDATGKKYLDLIHRLRVETGQPSELWDGSHLITAHFIEYARSLQK